MATALMQKMKLDKGVFYMIGYALRLVNKIVKTK